MRQHPAPTGDGILLVSFQRTSSPAPYPFFVNIFSTFLQNQIAKIKTKTNVTLITPFQILGPSLRASNISVHHPPLQFCKGKNGIYNGKYPFILFNSDNASRTCH